MTKGWKKLLLVLSALWLLAIVAAVFIEYNSINDFERFDTNIPDHIFWTWKQTAPATLNGLGWESPAEATLFIKPVIVISTAVAPIITLWLLAWAIARVRKGSNNQNS